MVESTKELDILDSNSNDNLDTKKNIKEEKTNLEKKIIYSKYNKFIFKTKNGNSFSKKQNLIYNFFKFGINIVLALFLITSLTVLMWQTSTLYYNNFNIQSMNNALGKPYTDDFIYHIMSSSMFPKNGIHIDTSIFFIIITMLAVLLLLFIPILVFKNGTLLSVISLSLGLVLLIVIIWLLSILISFQNNYMMIVFETNHLSSLETLTDDESQRLKSILDWIIKVSGN